MTNHLKSSMPEKVYIYETKLKLGVTYWENHVRPTVTYVRADLVEKMKEGE